MPVKRKKVYTKAPKERDQGKWQYARLQTFHRALKKAKLFEIGKIKRRMAAVAADDASLGKLQRQLQAAKHADLVRLTNVLSEQCGWPTRLTESSVPSQPAAADGSADDQALQEAPSTAAEHGRGATDDGGVADEPEGESSGEEGGVAGTEARIPGGLALPRTTQSAQAVVEGRLLAAACVKREVQDAVAREAIVMKPRPEPRDTTGSVGKQHAGARHRKAPASRPVSKSASPAAARASGLKRKSADGADAKRGRNSKRPREQSASQGAEALAPPRPAKHTKVKATEAAMHPSWIAKRQAASQLAAGPTGKKVVFDD